MHDIDSNIYLITHFSFDLLHCVHEENGGSRVRGTHLGLRSLKSREEGGV